MADRISESRGVKGSNRSAKNFRQGGFQCFGFCPRCGIFGAHFIEKVWYQGFIKNGKLVGQRIDRKCQECDWVWLEID